MENLKIVQAMEKDAQEVYALYHSLIDAPYSTWSEDYPSRELVFDDVCRGKTLVMRDENGRIVAAIALLDEEDEPEFDQIAPWDGGIKKWAIPARLGVCRDMQGRGLAKKMLQKAMDMAKDEGCGGVRFLVAKSNPVAQRAYEALSFDICGEARMWEEDWLCYQKRL